MTQEHDFLPKHTTEERENLRADIEKNGLQVSVVLDELGNIIDGRLRAEIADELKLDWKKAAKVHLGLSDIEKQALRIRLNILRRSTPATQQQRKEFQRILLLAHPQMSDGAIAKMTGSSQPTISRLRGELIQANELTKPTSVVGSDGIKRKVSQKKPTTIVQSSRDYDVTVKFANTPGIQLPNDLVTPKTIRRESRRAAAEQRALTTTPQTPPENIQLFHSDFRNLSIEPGSVDLVLTDVLWDDNSESDWKDLADLVGTWLNEDGLFASFIGQRNLLKLAKAMERTLHYQTIFPMLFSDGHSMREHNGLYSKYRPILVMSKKENYKFRSVQDVLKSGGMEKDYHEFQQSLEATREILQRLSLPGNLVVDPCMGTGTAAVAVLTATDGPRRFIGSDRDETMFRKAQFRVGEAAGNANAA